ncbi:momilactone a synthase [Nicotiana attenuata]|uniref:Momilactone a synthase n=1 Tax=Nicotiana attenuata TaxID=49451 RepID=A0A314KJI9_NICAT|nr:momilactone a synthase [Nicotiana attenuata]
MFTEKSIFVHCNVAIESDVQNAVDATIAKFGKLDIMFSNAGIAPGKPISSILDVDYDIINNVFDVNVVGAFFSAKHTARVMIPANIRGAIVFTAGEYGIKVNCVSPYFISTPLVLNRTGMDKQMADELFAEGGNLKGALLDEEDVAKAVLYLTSDDSKYVSGMNSTNYKQRSVTICL